MAGSKVSQSQRLAQLRATAQSHLYEIESEKAQEEVQMTQAEIDIQRYAKMSSFDRRRLHGKQSQLRRNSDPDQQYPPSVSENSSSVELKKDRFRPFQEILHRIQWDPKLHIDDYVVGYLERFEGIKEMAATSWVKDFSEEEWIPMHRVRYVKRVHSTRLEGTEDAGPDQGIVWDRDGRIDKFSRTNNGSGMLQQEDILSVDGTSVTGGVTIS